ncbi:hypothetical protein BJF79_40870 [Actinomadura sp. CNU-125]|nr:hypothetical protein BJF79_40870 [Actinomadura sp. CNU-125]
MEGPVQRPVPEARHGTGIGAVDHHGGDRAGVPVDLPGFQHAEHVALRVGQDRPGDVALAHVGGRRAEILQARDQLSVVGLRGGGEIEVHAVLHRFGVLDGDQVDVEARGVGPVEARGFEVGDAGSLAGRPPAERLRPEAAEGRVVPGLEVHLNESQRHAADHRSAVR